MGQNIFEYSHPCDHEEIKDILSAKSQDITEQPKSFFIRLKCTLTSKGRNVNLKSATYKVIFTHIFLFKILSFTYMKGTNLFLAEALRELRMLNILIWTRN